MERTPNYQKQLEALITSLRAEGRRPSLLLHACCAPCSSAVLECLSQAFAVTIYYYNPNIHPETEYRRRLDELRGFLPRFPPAAHVALVEEAYDPEDFFRATQAREEPALQDEPEKGERCRRCYELRMRRAFGYACAHGFDYFTTTLSISPFKDARKINTIGNTFVSLDTTAYLPADFKKKGGFLRSLELSKEYGLWRQDYCGCVYSLRNKSVPLPPG